MANNLESSLGQPQHHSERSRLQRIILPCVSLIIFLIASNIIYQTLQDIDLLQLVNALGQLTFWQLALAVVFTAASYLVLSGYDWLALHHIYKKLPYRTVALAAFCGTAISYTVGMNLLSGGSVRYRVYVAAGLKGLDVVHVTAYGMAAFTFGTCFLGAFALTIQPEFIADALNLPVHWLEFTGVLVLILCVSFIIFTFFRQSPVSIGRWKLRLPSGPSAIAQLLISVVDILLAAGCFFILIPVSGIPFFGFIIIYSFGVVAGMLSNIPGGLGVFDSIMLLSLAYTLPAESLAAALLVYRIIYYLIPLGLATALLATHEILERSSRVQTSTPSR